MLPVMFLMNCMRQDSNISGVMKGWVKSGLSSFPIFWVLVWVINDRPSMINLTAMFYSFWLAIIFQKHQILFNLSCLECSYPFSDIYTHVFKKKYCWLNNKDPCFVVRTSECYGEAFNTSCYDENDTSKLFIWPANACFPMTSRIILQILHRFWIW